MAFNSRTEQRMILFHLICVLSICAGMRIPSDLSSAPLAALDPMLMDASAVNFTATLAPNTAAATRAAPATEQSPAPILWTEAPSTRQETQQPTTVTSTPSSEASTRPPTAATTRRLRIEKRKGPETKSSSKSGLVDAGEAVDSLEACYASQSNGSSAAAVSPANANADDLSVSSKEYSRSLIRGSHKFSLDMMRFLSNFESKETSQGILISPFSVWSALVVLYMGSRGETESEIRSALQLQSIPKHATGMAYQGLKLWYQLKQNSSDSSLLSQHRKYAYSAANRIFVNKQYDINSCIKSNFPTEVEPINFADSDASIVSINAWVERLTRGKIKHLMAPDSVNSWTQIVVANAVYFRSQWMTQFDQANSVLGEFTVNPVESMNVTFMKQTGSFMFGVSESLGATALDIPYADQQFSMLILLPETSTGVDSLIKSLQPDDIYDLVSHMYSDEVEVSLPKFKLEQEFDLAGPLFSLGIKRLFDPRFADLSGFFANASLFDAGLTVNSVVHKTAITVNEEGTEAAAATAFVVSRSGRPLFPTKFTVDRPFVFLIRDTATNVILFTGVVRRPNQLTT